jgi:pyruvate/2-oxoglutarate dehydrogenase complex dihydrolipoamide dehydrogenase (E3) component
MHRGGLYEQGMYSHKTLLHSARIMKMARADSRRGITVEGLVVNADKIAVHRGSIVKTKVKAQEAELSKRRGELVNGTGEIISPREVTRSGFSGMRGFSPRHSSSLSVKFREGLPLSGGRLHGFSVFRGVR